MFFVDIEGYLALRNISISWDAGVSLTFNQLRIAQKKQYLNSLSNSWSIN